MTLAILGLGAVSFVISWVVTFAMKRIAPRIGFVDKPGHRKIHHNPKPLGGGVAIFLGFVLPLLIGLVAAWIIDPAAKSSLFPQFDMPALIGGVRQQTPLALC